MMAAPGASPWSSIGHAGTPGSWVWLRRSRRWCSTGCAAASGAGRRPDEDRRDVVIGALLGADEFGFATAPLVAEGLITMRSATSTPARWAWPAQDPVLRKKFAGRPEHVVNAFLRRR